MLKYVRLIGVVMVMAVNSHIAVAQPAGGGPGGPPAGGPPPCWPPPCIPIDGGIGFLLIAGAAFGAKKLHDYKKFREDQSS